MSISHLLIYEPRLGGHHLTWLKYVTEDFLVAGLTLTLAVDLRSGSKGVVHEKLADLSSEIKIISAYSQNGKYKGGSKIASLCLCFKESGAEEIFMTNFDEIASAILRRAAIGMMPPKSLKGRLSGIYFRPRFMESCCRPLGNMLKYAGFNRLCRGGWLKNIYLLDEYLIDSATSRWPGCQFNFLPDVCSGDFSHDQSLARKKLNIPKDKFVYLNYGIGTRRKGLHLVIKAMLSTEFTDSIFLLCAGKITDDKELQEGVVELEERGLARVLNRYVSDYEEELSFAACDAVLLPYVKHFGSSGVLSRAAAAGKMVVASDEGLVAKRVCNHKLGLLFKSEDVDSLRRIMVEGKRIGMCEIAVYKKNLLKYSASCARDVFGESLNKPFIPLLKKKGTAC